jgi:hypothetical protein
MLGSVLGIGYGSGVWLGLIRVRIREDKGLFGNVTVSLVRYGVCPSMEDRKTSVR